MNTSGQRVSDALVELDRDLAREELNELRDQQVEDFLAQGRQIRAGLQLITHEDAHPRDYDVAEMRAWLREAWSLQGQMQGVLQGISEGDTARGALGKVQMGRWVRESGLTPDEAAQELTRRMNAGESMPWES